MRVYWEGPTTYKYNIPMFEEKGKITERVITGLENVLAAYTGLAELQAKKTENNITNCLISDIYVVGSGARINKIHSDMDLLLITPNLDESSAKNLMAMLSVIFYTERGKNEAIDVYIRQRDIYPARESINIKDQVKEMLDKYNNSLLENNNSLLENPQNPQLK